MSNPSSYEDNTIKKTIGIIIGVIIVALIAIALIYLVDVDQTKEVRLPSIDVDVKGGQMPAFDADVADIDVRTKPVEVEVPTMDVKTKTYEVEVPVGADVGTQTETISVPTIDITPPRADSPDNDRN